MLEFERAVQAPDDKAAVYVFADIEKGHIIYLSHTGAMTVVEQDKSKSDSRVRAAGFMVSSGGCSSCDGC